MPFLSGLAREAVVFDQMVNPSGWTNESLISIFTSLSSPVHKVETRGRSLDPQWMTPIEILKEYGYQAPRAQGTDNHLNLGFDEVSTLHPAPPSFTTEMETLTFFSRISIPMDYIV